MINTRDESRPDPLLDSRGEEKSIAACASPTIDTSINFCRDNTYLLKHLAVSAEVDVTDPTLVFA